MWDNIGLDCSMGCAGRWTGGFVFVGNLFSLCCLLSSVWVVVDAAGL